MAVQADPSPSSTFRQGLRWLCCSSMWVQTAEAGGLGHRGACGPSHQLARGQDASPASRCPVCRLPAARHAGTQLPSESGVPCLLVCGRLNPALIRFLRWW